MMNYHLFQCIQRILYGYNSDKLSNFKTDTMFAWQAAILKATSLQIPLLLVLLSTTVNSSKDGVISYDAVFVI